jgi:hypothetical protein
MCVHNQGFYTKQVVNVLQFYDADGLVSTTDYELVGKASRYKKAYCASCEKSIGWLLKIEDGKAKVVPFAKR